MEFWNSLADVERAAEASRRPARYAYFNHGKGTPGMLFGVEN